MKQIRNNKNWNKERKGKKVKESWNVQQRNKKYQ
jgi:hypothetical protein